MSNLEKAAKLLMPNPRWCELVHKGEGGNPCMYCEADAEAGAVRLADAGLITPDLPKPDAHGDWELAGGVTVTADDGEIIITEPLTDEHTMICWYGQPHNARELADALTAAAQHAEADQ